MPAPRRYTDADRARVHDLAGEGLTIREISEKTGIGKTTVATILADPPPAPAAAAEAPKPDRKQDKPAIAAQAMPDTTPIGPSAPAGDRARLEALLRGLAGHPDAAQAVARELRTVQASAWADALDQVATTAATSRPDIDPGADPLDIARWLFQRHVDDMADLKPDSPRLNQAKSEARQITKLIESLEEKRAKDETPEDAAARRRRDDGETRREILRYVEQAEAEAAKPREGAPFGVCVTCGVPRTAPTEAA